MQRTPYNGDSGFIGGVALRNYQRDVQAQAANGTESSGAGTTRKDSQSSVNRPMLSPINTSLSSRPPPQALRNTKQPQSFSTPIDLQKSTSTATGRRPAGTRLTSDPPALATTSSNTEQHKAKKGLPFLKNPMSTLLMRRKNNQNVPDLRPLPLKSRTEEPTYDPRIKGTRVHDFSAPRIKKLTADKEKALPQPNASPNIPIEPEWVPNPLNHQSSNAPIPVKQQRHKSVASESLGSASQSTASKQFTHTPSVTSENTKDSGAERTSLDDMAAPPPVPPKDEIHLIKARPSNAVRPMSELSTGMPRSTDSTRTNRTRNVSLSGMSGKEVLSALPRHMKSTSSRFSFDMIGAAKQEKLLEDRHRQRELEKKATDPPAPRDSRFDDFDDDFDYDAMMDDDGLEERIPGVNADLEDEYYEEEINMVGDDDYEEEINMVGEDLDEDIDDPDNDQENFSGFTFQRSNPASSLASPHSAGILPTPRDAEGKVIGFAMSKDTPGIDSAVSPNLLTPEICQDMGVQAAGLGIQGLDLSGPTDTKNETAFQQNQQLPPSNGLQGRKPDDLYFDDGMIGFENEFAEDLAASPEWDTAPFDESIFDNNDTDQFGRPIAGAFAQAQSDRAAALQETTKRESDITTSQVSALSGASHSTAHTSVSVDAHAQPPQPAHPGQQTAESLQKAPSQDEGSVTHISSPGEDTMAAYQAALAEAAQKAEASGKFQRDSSSPGDEIASSEVGNSPATPYRGGSRYGEDFDDYGDQGYSYEDMADFELDDDAIIAEANADALANDSDGWYGQEFGFYSAPVGQHSNREPSSESVDFEYANGGFFGPKGGINRTISGRMVSREPNLTPITERSEYSNRNSMMSLGMPGFSTSTPIQSPGLAQLAMMSDRGDEMTLSALLRLRSKAWGGSQASLSSREGSPRSERGDAPSSPWGPNFFSPSAQHARKNSVFSTVSHDTEGGSISGSPTLTTGVPGFTATPPLPSSGLLEKPQEESVQALQSSSTQSQQPQPLQTNISPVSEASEPSLSATVVSPIEPLASTDSNAARRPGMGHRHKGSSDSISYTKEEDSGETRWVIERRRTSELGQVEILGRQVVEGGRI